MMRSWTTPPAALLLMLCAMLLAMTADSFAKPKKEATYTRCNCGCTWYSAPGVIGGSGSLNVTIASSSSADGRARCEGLSGRKVECKGRSGQFGVCTYTGDGMSGQTATGDVRAPVTGGAGVLDTGQPPLLHTPNVSVPIGGVAP